MYGWIVCEGVDVGRCVSSQCFPSHLSEVIQQVKRLLNTALQLHLQHLPSLFLHVRFCHAVLCWNFSVLLNLSPIHQSFYPSIHWGEIPLVSDPWLTSDASHATNIWHVFGILFWHISFIFNPMQAVSMHKHICTQHLILYKKSCANLNGQIVSLTQWKKITNQTLT